MPSQTKYIFEAAVAILLALITVQSIYFLSSAELYKNPNHIVVDNDVKTKKQVFNTAGEHLFQQHCARCHALHKYLTGPGLATVETRVPDRKLLVAWIKNNQQVLQSGNVYFNTLFREYNKTPMDLFPQLTESDIHSILDYLKESNN